jgi:hypothetical protein
MFSLTMSVFIDLDQAKVFVISRRDFTGPMAGRSIKLEDGWPGLANPRDTSLEVAGVSF